MFRCGVATVILGVTVSVWLLQSPVAQMNLRQRDALHWRRFLDGVERLLFLMYVSVSPATVHLHRYLFRGLALIVFVVGLRVLVPQRQTARIVFLVSLAASLAGFHILAGPMILRRFPTHRYGMVFVAPIVLAFAFLSRGFWPRAGSSTRLRRAGPGAAGDRMGVAPSVKWNYFDHVAPHRAPKLSGPRSGPQDPYARTLAVIRDDLARTRSAARGPVGDGPGNRGGPADHRP